MPPGSRRCARTMRKLHTVEKRMQFLPSGSTTACGEEIPLWVKDGKRVVRAFDKLSVAIFCGRQDGWTSRHVLSIYSHIIIQPRPADVFLWFPHANRRFYATIQLRFVSRIRNHLPVTKSTRELTCIDSASAQDFKPTPSPNQQTTWDNAALYQQPLMSDLSVKSQLGDPPPILWSQGGSEMSPIPPIPPSGGMGMTSETHIQTMNRNTGLGIRQPGSPAWQQHTASSIALQSNTQMAPDYSDQFHTQLASQNFRNSSYQSLNPSIPELIPGQMPVSLDPTQNTPASLGYQTWNSPFLDPSNQGIAGAGPDSMGGWYTDPLRLPRTRETE